MIIKRGPFLLLTAALAQQACASDDKDNGTSTNTNTTSSGGTGDGGSSTTEGGSGGTFSTSSGGGSGGTMAGAAGETDTGGAAGEQGTSGGSAGQAGESGDTGGTSASGGTGGTGGGASGGTGGGGTCDDSVGSPASCAETGCTDFSLDYCNVAVANLKPAVAEAAVDCFAASETCSSTDAYECVGDALAGACPDPYQDVFCADAVTACSFETITEEECHMMVDGLNDYGIAQIYSCVEAGCEFGLWSCVESLN